MPTSTATAKKKIIKAGIEYRIPHTDLVIKENIRNNASNIDEKMLNSIRENGVTAPLWVTPDYVLIDGECRYHCCNAIAAERGVSSIEVPIIVRDIAEKDFALVQFTLGFERKNIDAGAVNRAIERHQQRNPNTTITELAELFHTSITTAFRCIRIQKAPTLNKLVSETKLTQNAALQVIDYFLDQCGVEDDQFDESATTRALDSAEELGKLLESNIAMTNQVEGKEDKKVQKTWNLRNINTYLHSVGKSQIPSKQAGEKIETKKFNLPALVQEMLDSFTITPLDDDKVSFSGTLTVEQLQALKDLSQEKKKGTLTEFVSTDSDKDAWDLYVEYSKQYRDHIVIAQESLDRYRSFESSMELIQQVLEIAPVYVQGIKMSVITKRDMRTVVTQLLNKGWNVIRVNKEAPKTRLKRGAAPKESPAPTPVETQEASDAITKDLEALNSQTEEVVKAEPVGTLKGSKLQQKLNTAPIEVDEENLDEEFAILAAGGDYEQFMQTGVASDET